MPGIREVVPTRVGRIPKVLTDAATISGLDCSEADMFQVTLGGNRTLSLPTSANVGQEIWIWVIQDSTGSRTLTMTGWKKTATFTLTTTASHRDLIRAVYDGTDWWAVLHLDLS